MKTSSSEPLAAPVMSAFSSEMGMELSNRPTTFPPWVSNHGIAIGTFVNGGTPSVVTISNTAATTNNIAICTTDGAGHVTAVNPFSVGHGGLATVAVGDFNGDGNEDIAVLSQTDATVTVLLGNGNGTFQRRMRLQNRKFADIHGGR